MAERVDIGQQFIHCGIGMFVQELTSGIGDILEVDFKHVPHKSLQILIAEAVLEEAVSFLEVRLQDPFLGVIKGVLQQPNNLPLVSRRRMPASRCQELHKSLPAPAMATASSSHVLERGGDGSFYLVARRLLANVLKLQFQ